MSLRVLVFGLGSIALLLAFLGWRSVGGGSDRRAEDTAVVRLERTSSPSSAGASVAGGGFSADLERAPDGRTEFGDRVPALAAVPSESTESLALRVLDAAGTVVKNAEVTVAWFDPRAASGAPPRPTGPIAVPVHESDPRSVGRRDRATTDGFGTARVPWRSADFRVTVLSDVGCASIRTSARDVVRGEEGDRTLDVRIEPASTLRVRVVDSNGSPVRNHEVRLITSPSTKRTVRAWALTDIEGRAHFVGWTSWVPAARVMVVAHWPTQDTLSGTSYAQAIEPESPPEVEILLQLGETGRLRVRWESGPDGPGEQARGEITWTANAMAGYGKHPPTVRGRTREVFERLPLGKTWDVEARTESGHIARAKVMGPTRDGETVDVVLGREAVVERSTARLLGPSGRPLVRAQVAVTALSGRQLDGRTDHRGRIEFAVPPGRVASTRGVRWRVTLRDGRVFGAHRREAAPKVGALGADLGDVELVPARTLLDATLVDEVGEPLALTDVIVLAATKERRSRVEYDGGTWGVQWPARTDEAGRLKLVDVFDEREFSAGLDALSLRVRVQREDFDPWHVFGDAPTRARDAKIVAMRPGRLQWRIGPAVGLEGTDVRWRLIARDGATTPFRQPSRSADGTLVLESVMPGRFDLEARSKGPDERVLARLEGLEIESGKTTDAVVPAPGGR